MKKNTSIKKREKELKYISNKFDYTIMIIIIEATVNFLVSGVNFLVINFLCQKLR